MNGDHEPLGKLWVSHFTKRQPRVASMVGRSIEAARVEAASPEILAAFFKLFEHVLAKYNIPMSDVWNLDEMGVALGVCTNSQVLGSSTKKKAYLMEPGNREWASVLETVSASGRKLRCLVIFKGKYLHTTWFPAEYVPDWMYTTSENGWTSNDIGQNWLEQIFIPETDPGPGRYRLLILDGHSSHIHINFMWLCKLHKIILLYFPAHCTHVLQPLDLACFSVVKSNYRQKISDLAALDDAAPVKKEKFIKYYHAAREEALSDRVIRAGWKASGLSPFNPEKVLRSSQVSQQDGRPSTPPPLSKPPSPVFQTPQKPQDLYQAQQRLQSSESLSRSARRVLGKAGKAISKANIRAAHLEAQNRRLQAQLDKFTNKYTRKRVKINPNERFSNVVKIMAALDRAAMEKAEKAMKKAVDKANKSISEAATQISQAALSLN
jgi:hypothetical protein